MQHVKSFHNLQVHFSALHICPTNGSTSHRSNEDEALGAHAGACLMHMVSPGGPSLHLPLNNTSKMCLYTLFAKNDYPIISWENSLAGKLALHL